MGTQEEFRTAIMRTLRLSGPEIEQTADKLIILFSAWGGTAAPPTEMNSASPEPRVPAYDPTQHHLPTDFPDIAEGYLREKAQQAHYQWHNTKREAEQRVEQLSGLWGEFERFEDAADVLMRARGGGPQPPTETAPAFVPPREGVDY